MDQKKAAAVFHVHDRDPMIMIYGVFPALLYPENFTAPEGTKVFTKFLDAWDEVQAPFLGERRLYSTVKPESILRTIKGRPWVLLDASASGWNEVTPEDVRVIQVDDRLEGMKRTRYKSVDSWLERMREEVARYIEEEAPFPSEEEFKSMTHFLNMNDKLLRQIIVSLPLDRAEEFWLTMMRLKERCEKTERDRDYFKKVFEGAGDQTDPRPLWERVGGPSPSPPESEDRKKMQEDLLYRLREAAKSTIGGKRS